MGIHILILSTSHQTNLTPTNSNNGVRQADRQQREHRRLRVALWSLRRCPEGVEQEHCQGQQRRCWRSSVGRRRRRLKEGERQAKHVKLGRPTFPAMWLAPRDCCYVKSV